LPVEYCAKKSFKETPATINWQLPIANLLDILYNPYGGRIQVSSEFGKGSRFAYFMPERQARKKNG